MAFSSETSSFNLILVAESEFVFDFPARDVNDYVEVSTLPTLMKFTFCFWMKRGFDGSLAAGILSYATAQEVKSLLVTFGVHGGLNLRVMDSRYATQFYALHSVNMDTSVLQTCLFIP